MSRPAALALVLTTALLLTGCADRSSPADAGATGAATPTGVDQQAAASIEDSVSAAEQLLEDLERDFEQDAVDVG